VEHQRREREVVHPIDLTRDVDLRLVMRMDFDEHIHAERARLCGEVGDERERL